MILAAKAVDNQKKRMSVPCSMTRTTRPAIETIATDELVGAAAAGLTFEVEDVLVPLLQPVVVKRRPVRHVGLQRLVDAVEQPPRDALCAIKYQPTCVSAHIGKRSDRARGKRGKKRRTARMSCAGMQCTSNS
jgi:hypothetical protein